MARCWLVVLMVISLKAHSALEPVGFSDWKTQQVTKSQSLMEKARETALKTPGNATIARAKLVQAQFEQARELTISDYFAGYVLNFAEDKSSMVKIVQKLSPDENAQLLLMFAKNLSHQKDAKVQRSADRLFFE